MPFLLSGLTVQFSSDSRKRRFFSPKLITIVTLFRCGPREGTVERIGRKKQQKNARCFQQGFQQTQQKR